MLRFYAITLSYSLVFPGFILFEADFLLKTILLFFFSTAYILVLVYGVANIRLQLFVKAINSVPNKSNQIAITFDDGPHSEHTPQLLDILKKYNATATFFMIGENIVNNKSLAKRIINEGHVIGNHTYSHKNIFPVLDRHKMVNEITKTQELIEDISNSKTRYFRPPFGVTNPLIAKATAIAKMETIGWSIRSFDTCKKSKESILDKIKIKLKGGDIILLHDKTADVCWLTEQTLILAKSKGYDAVNIDILLN